MKKVLNFSNKFLQATYLENVKRVSVKDYAILVNLSKKPINVDGTSPINLHKSYLLKNLTVNSDIDKAILVEMKFNPIEINKKLEDFCVKNWNSNKKRYPDEPNRWKFKILKSSMDNVDNLEFNFWYLPGKTASRIHREHPFIEVHTQLYGVGIMNKFKKEDYNSLYQRMYMPPGYTHDYLFNEKGIYPWHQYEAVTNSIWMAIVEN